MDSDSVQLGSKKRRRVRARGDHDGGDSLELLSDSELTTNNRKMRLEDTTVFSDACDDLPSSRARLAASRRYMESQRSTKNHKETTPLLDDMNDRGTLKQETSFVQMEGQNIVLSPPSNKTKNSSQWPRLKKW